MPFPQALPRRPSPGLGVLFKELGSLPEFFLWELCRIQDNLSPHNHFGVLLWNKLYTTLRCRYGDRLLAPSNFWKIYKNNPTRLRENMFVTLMAQIIEWSMAKLLIARWRMSV
uniref:Uncharacterized protein n=1 Tax=Triticum urartu TaxID=4572 RepID=A0A8R7TUC6_TRIUA